MKNSIYNFNGFSYKPDTRELINDNQSVNLRRKVAAVLEILLKNQHRIVEREELLTLIWREGTMRENSLLQCIRELRKLLGDSAQQPRYIKTYHTKGYQWIDSCKKQTNQRSYPSLQKTFKNQVQSIPKYKYFYNKATSYYSISLSILVMVSVLSFVYLATPTNSNVKQATANPTTVIILPFNNHTGDTSLQWLQLGLTDMVISALTQSSQLNIVPMYVVQQAISQQLPSENINTLFTSLQTDYIIKSTITKTDTNQYQLNYKIFNHNGEFKSNTLSSNDIISTIPAIVQNFNQELNRNTLTKKKILNNISTLSKNNHANLNYANGIHMLKTKGALMAKPHFEAARKIDPNFMWANAQQALVLSQLGDWLPAKIKFQGLLAQSKLLADPALKTFVQLNLAKIFIDQSLLSQAKVLLQSVVDNNDQHKNSYAKVTALWDLSRIAEYRSQWFSQKNYAKQAMALSVNHRELRIKADNLYYLGSPSNSRLEFDSNIDMQKNRERLERALQYYQQLNDVSSQAKTLLSLGENYTFTFEERINFLNQAEKLYSKLNNKMQLLNTLSYTGYLYIQYHRGGKALFPIQRSYQISKAIGAINAELLNHFLLAFSAMDQGIRPPDKTNKTQYLNIAKQQFINLLEDSRLSKNSQLYADASLLLGWTVSEQGEHESAINYIKQAHTLYQNLKLTTSTEYSVMSLTKEHIAMKNWQLAIQLENNPNQNKRTRQYLSRSYYELKQYNKAIELAELNKTKNIATWSAQDEAQLMRYKTVNANQQYLTLPPEPSAHANYCETLPVNI
ncbi:hypothetical protein MNBD_GAMMA22-2096 [hydrothermal vent metagenome]|uniref:OmpR/PhoB-type domain-containing protein n=1 Tax=hydrothermal vent metagenome TaxID=652676 RepID=A0A3B1B9J0_9ZZZZ